MFRTIRVVVPDRSERRSFTPSPAGIGQVRNQFVDFGTNRIFSVRNCSDNAFTVASLSVLGAG